MIPDPRTEDEGICGVTFIGSTGIEWVCIAHVHAKAYVRKSSDARHLKGSLIFNNNRRVDAHYFVNRWPNRPSSKESDV
jgi:hypothetical protein